MVLWNHVGSIGCGVYGQGLWKQVGLEYCGVDQTGIMEADWFVLRSI